MRPSSKLVWQTTEHDCAAACLATSLRHFGVSVGLAEVKCRCELDDAAVSMEELGQAASTLGFDWRAVECSVGDLAEQPHLAILHWNGNHYVVAERARHGRIRVYDPRAGVKLWRTSTASRYFSNAALILMANRGTPSVRQPSVLRLIVGRLVEKRTALCGLVTLSVLAQVGGLSIPVVFRIVANEVIPAGTFSLKWELLLLGVAVPIMVAVAGAVRNAIRSGLYCRVSAGLQEDLVGCTSQMRCGFFRAYSAGDIVARIRAAGTACDGVLSATVDIGLDLVQIVGYLTLILVSDASLAVVVIAIGLLRFGVYWACRERISAAARRATQKDAEMMNSLVEFYENTEEITLAGLVPDIVTKMKVQIVRYGRLRGRTLPGVTCTTTHRRA